MAAEKMPTRPSEPRDVPGRAATLGIREDLRLCLRYCTREGIVAMPIVTMALPGSMAISALVTKGFPLSSTAIGVLGSLPFVGNFLQIFVSPFLMRWRPPKVITVCAASLHLLCWVALGFILPWIPRDSPARASLWIVGWFLVSSCFGAVAGVSWSTWIEEWVPARIRGKFFGRRNQILQLSTVVFLMLSGWILSRWEYSVAAFQAVIFGSAFLRVFSLRWQALSPTRPHRPPAVAPDSFRGQLEVLRGSGSFLLFVLFGAVWSFAANCFGPFYTVFMFDRVGFSALDVGVVTALSQVGGALSLPAWGRLLDRHGNKSVMVFSLILWQLSMFLWCIVDPGNRAMLYGLWTWIGATSAGFVLGQFMILLRLIPAEAKKMAIGFNLAVSSLVAAIAPVLGGWVLSHAPAGWGGPLQVYHICFLVQPVVALAGGFLLLRVREPAASPFSSVVGAMRNIRTLGGVLGLSFLVNYVFVDKTPRRGRP
jgi:MFS family permease